MKPSGVPKRRVPLLRGKPPRRSALRRSQAARDVGTEPPPRSRRSRVRDSRLQQFHEAVGFRAAGRCEARCAPACTGRYDEAHHVVPRGRGVGWPWLNDADRNGLGCCGACHEWIHRPPRADAQLPKLWGLLQSRPPTDADPGPLLPRLEAMRRND